MRHALSSWRYCSTRLLVVAVSRRRWWAISRSRWWAITPGGVLLGGLSDLVQHELGDWVGEGGGHGQQVRLGLVTVLIGDELHLNVGAIRGGVAVG